MKCLLRRQMTLALLKPSKVTLDFKGVGVLIHLAAALQRADVRTGARALNDLVVCRVMGLVVVLVVVLGRRRRVLVGGREEGEHGPLRGRKASNRHRRGLLLVVVVVSDFVEAKKSKLFQKTEVEFLLRMPRCVWNGTRAHAISSSSSVVVLGRRRRVVVDGLGVFVLAK